MSSAWAGSSLGLPDSSLGDLIRSVKRGLPIRTLETFSAASGLELAELSEQLGIPARTMARRKSAGRLSSEESERALRLALLFEKARALFDGNASDALQWLQMPRKALGGESPLAYSATELGAREVENLIGRLEHGVFS